DRNRSHWSTSKTPSYTKSVSWHHHRASVRHKSTMKKRSHVVSTNAAAIDYALTFKRNRD
ncbi:hypothetical protein P2R91_20535, partial [Escherichia coli]